METPRRHVAVIGAGYVGLVTAVSLARLGHSVQLVETFPDRLDALRARRVPIHESGLQVAFESALDTGRLSVANALNGPVEVVLVCVGTPIGSDGRSDLSQLKRALSDLAPVLAQDVPLVIRSTLPPGSTRLVVEWAQVPTARVLTNPEFLRQGTALEDFLHPSRLVIGHFPDASPKTIAMVAGLFDQIATTSLIVDVATAELIKNGANAFLALKLSFANEMASLSEEYDADVEQMLAGIALDPRIGPHYLRPAFGFGGSCLPKELRALATAGLDRGLGMHVTMAASEANLASQDRFVARIDQILKGVAGRPIALLGLAFKAGTDDVRDSPALHVARRLLDSGAVLKAYDPEAMVNARHVLPSLNVTGSAEAALSGADLAVIATEWSEFRDLPWAQVRRWMRQPTILDGRRLLDTREMRALGFRYSAIGSLEDAARSADVYMPSPLAANLGNDIR